LTVDEPRPGLTRAARGLAPVPTPGIMHPHPDAGPAPGPESMGDGLRGRKIGGKHAPFSMPATVGWKWKVDEYRHKTGSSMSKS
jgi:hypothetical protein